MSYLNVPRLHFAGQFIGDPSTVNNIFQNFELDTQLTGTWNPNGTGAFSVQDCQVTAVTYTDGTTTTDPTVDPLVNAPLTSIPPQNPFGAKLVDLDPYLQMVSQIWAMQLSLGRGDSNSISGTFETAAFMDIWFNGGPGGQAGARAWYQSVMSALDWGSQPGSTFLQQLQAASPDLLSIKFMVDRYNAHNPALGNGPPNFPDPHNDMAFTHGRIVGSIGPADAREPKHFVAARLLRPASPQSPMFFAPCLYDQDRNTIVLDLGNSLQAADLIEQNMLDIGELNLTLMVEGGDAHILGSIPTSTYTDANFYPNTAGIIEFPLGALSIPNLGQLLQQNPLAVSSHPVPKFSANGAPFLQENPDGSFVRADQFVFRLNVGEPVPDVAIYATEFGKPLEGAVVNLTLLPQSPRFSPNAGIPQNAIGLSESEPTPTKNPTDWEGKTTHSWSLSNPGDPRPDDLDGQTYLVSLELPGKNDELPDQNLTLSVHLYEDIEMVDHPTWWDNIRDIFAQYAQLYPVMSFLPLDRYQTFHTSGQRIRDHINKPLEDPMYMPVTRDLSASKLALINRWFDQGMPEGTPPAQA